MSQYSLSTCDPLKTTRADRKDVRRTPHIPVSVSTVLFNAGTMDTFPVVRDEASSPEDMMWRTIPEAFDVSAPPSKIGSVVPPLESDAEGALHDSVVMAMRDRDTVFGGPVVDSPCVSRAGTMDESTGMLPWSQADASTTRRKFARMSFTRTKKQKPSPLGASPTNSADSRDSTPVATPTTPSALVRAFGAFVKSLR